jgi:hypothetical protein
MPFKTPIRARFTKKVGAPVPAVAPAEAAIKPPVVIKKKRPAQFSLKKERF